MTLESPDLKAQFLQAMARAAQTVNIVTTDGPAGRAGVTVSAMSSVSAEGAAPTMLVCVHHLSPAAATIIQNGAFAVTILRDDQSHVSDTFAGRIRRADGNRFACTDWVTMAPGVPRVAGALAAFGCRVVSAERVGTHHIFLGEVAEAHVAEGSPLVYANRAYGSPVRLLSPPAAPATGAAYRIGTLAAFGPYLIPQVIRALQEAEGPVALDLHEGDQRQVLELLRAGAIDLAFLYDFDLGPGITAMTVAEVAPYVLLPAGDPLAGLPEVPLEALLPRPMVLLDAPPSRDYFLSLFEGVGQPQVAFRAKSFEMVRGFVGHGLGYALLATKPASAMSYDGKALVSRPLAGRHRPSRLVLCGREGDPRQPQVDRFVLHVAATFGLDLD